MDVAAEQRFREFVAARSPSLMRLAFLLTGGDQHAAEDLLQTALAKTVTHWRKVHEPEGYVRRVMYNQQVSWWRRGRRRRETNVAAVPDQAGVDDTAASDLKITMRRALSRLTQRQRTVLVLRYFEDLSEAEVARLLGCTVGTVRSTTHRSLTRLRALAPELADLKYARRALEVRP
jgi:RNA polymerase sigma-70 factor (sigma-E family)